MPPSSSQEINTAPGHYLFLTKMLGKVLAFKFIQCWFWQTCTGSKFWSQRVFVETNLTVYYLDLHSKQEPQFYLATTQQQEISQISSMLVTAKNFRQTHQHLQNVPQKSLQTTADKLLVNHLKCCMDLHLKKKNKKKRTSCRVHCSIPVISSSKLARHRPPSYSLDQE